MERSKLILSITLLDEMDIFSYLKYMKFTGICFLPLKLWSSNRRYSAFLCHIY